MSRGLILYFLVCTHISIAQQQSYATAFPDEYKNALEYYHANRDIIDSISTAYGVNSLFAFSIVAPETGRYLKWRDAFETSVVEMFYVQMGSDYNDYSIGPFQMKAAFAEKVEEHVAAMNFGIEIKRSFQYTESPGVKTRQARINRLKTVEGSMQYLCGFILAFLKMSDEDQQSCELQLVAAAYNYGFWRTKRDIEKHVNTLSFPQRGTENSFSYASVVMVYHEKLNEK